MSIRAWSLKKCRRIVEGLVTFSLSQGMMTVSQRYESAFFVVSGLYFCHPLFESTLSPEWR